ncbi:hypothetical protein [Deinococcus ruber]|uniref:Uncharacterized protein n=1 Tax=Deinococcus ruber TaxID=1848197 RepID=A0A918BX64_9DEIO|nr:hypothetical protein [Deinococcus ruber]GGQ95012.1 hypothetical protein GCM10008957_04130 [Deinococcus ruber]
MAFLKWLHDLEIPSAYALLAPTPLALACLILFVWSIGPAIRLKVGRPMVWWLRLTWVLTLIPAVTGVILALGGGKVASAVAAAKGVTKYGFAPDPKRNLEHWMYAALVLLSLYAIEVLIQGKLIKPQAGLRILPVATLFLYGVAYMVGRVAVFPGSGG